MGEVLLMVKKVTVFLLGATLLTRLFGVTEYKKYMEYATGLILIAIVAAPFFSFGEKAGIGEWISQGVFDQKSEDVKEEIRLLGNEYEKSVWERYKKQIRADVAQFCGVGETDCRVWLEGGMIERIEVRVKEEQPAQKRMQMSARYGVDADCIYFIE